MSKIISIPYSDHFFVTKFSTKFLRQFARQSFTIKLVVMLSIVVCLIVLIGTIVVMNITKQAIADTSVATALYQTELLKIKLLETMLNEDARHAQLKQLLESWRRAGHLNEVNIFDPQGEVRFSSLADNVGKQVSLSFGQKDRFTPDNAVIDFDNLGEKDRVRIVHPIRGSKQCMNCHQGVSDSLVGGIELFIPLKPIYQRFAFNRFLFIAAAFAAMVVGAFLIRWLVHRLLKRPIKELIQVMEKAKRGELDVRSRLHPDPDLNRLARTFNVMVREIDSAQRRIVEQHQREIAQSNRLASLGQFISNVSHEIKNPLASISSTLHALRNEFKSVDGREIFAEITLQIDRIERTVNNLLRYARQAPPQFDRCNLLDPIGQAVQLAEQNLIRSRVRLRVECKAKEPIILGDAGQLEQVFLNLLLNAVGAMSEGGGLHILIRTPDAEECRTHRLKQESGFIVEAADTGSGIREEDLPRIFEPFFTTRRGGTGLGLSVAKGIIEAHEGRIWVESLVGSGTKVKVFFPSAERIDSAEPDDRALQEGTALRG